MALLACPFCREMFEAAERKTCGVCGVALVGFDKLPPSADALAEDGIPHEPAWDALPFTYWRRSRGALALCAILGAIAFFAPWVHVTMPDIASLSGFDVARRVGWAWGAGVAWFVLLPTVLSRRSIMKMRGARVAAAFLAAIPALTAAILLARPPHSTRAVTLAFTWGWGLYATLALSVAAVVFAVLFGGSVDDIRLRRGTSAGQTVH